MNLDAVLNNNDTEIMKELRTYASYCFTQKSVRKKATFDMGDVLFNINEKLIRRHPHIFGNVEVSNEEDVKANWEKIKMIEGRKSVLEGVPSGLPAMVKAFRMQEKVKGVGFEWEKTEQVWDKVQEELAELNEEVKDNTSQDKVEEEFGDVLFALINYARFIGVNPENALEKTNKKFIKRFTYIEQEAAKMGRTLSEMTLEEMDAIWNKAKESK